jgi:hypothetical protein
MTAFTLRWSKLFALVALAAFATACGDDDDDDGGNPPADNRIVTVTGNATVFPPAAAVLDPDGPSGAGTYDPGDLSNLEVTLASALAELAPNNTNFLAPPVALTDAPGLGATFSVPNVDADDVGIAIIAHLAPAAGATAVQSHRVTTGILSVIDIPLGDLDPTLDTSVDGAPAFIVPAAFEAVLAPAIGTTETTLVSDGYILAVVTTGTAPVAGATITIFNAAGADVTGDYTIRYPTFTGPAGANTGPSGVAVITGEETTAPLTINASAASGQFRGLGGIKPDTTFVAPLIPQ